MSRGRARTHDHRIGSKAPYPITLHKFTIWSQFEVARKHSTSIDIHPVDLKKSTFKNSMNIDGLLTYYMYDHTYCLNKQILNLNGNGVAVNNNLIMLHTGKNVLKLQNNWSDAKHTTIQIE